MLVGACGTNLDDIKVPEPGFLGRQLDRGPTPAPVTETGGAHGAVLSGDQQPVIADARSDAAVGSELARWMNPTEKLALAEASQQAAIAERNTRLAWEATAPSGEVTASGWVMPVTDPYRSAHGLICRDLRQSLARDDRPLVQAVSLCREEADAGLHVWMLAHFP